MEYRLLDANPYGETYLVRAGPGFFHTYFWVDPERDLAAVLMTQRYPHKIPLQADFRAAVYGAVVTHQ